MRASKSCSSLSSPLVSHVPSTVPRCMAAAFISLFNQLMLNSVALGGSGSCMAGASVGADARGMVSVVPLVFTNYTLKFHVTLDRQWFGTIGGRPVLPPGSGSKLSPGFPWEEVGYCR